jgi:hypothetical protein
MITANEEGTTLHVLLIEKRQSKLQTITTKATSCIQIVEISPHKSSCSDRNKKNKVYVHMAS